MNLAWPTILHVEDDLGDKELLQHAFKATHVKCNIQWVGDGQAAIDYLCGTELFANRESFPMPNLVLLDLKLPRKNGFEVLQWLRAESQLKWLPVVVFTSSDSGKDIKQSFELGANSLIVKPAAFKELIACVADLHHYWFERNRQPSP